jgi:hypothetical protein
VWVSGLSADKVEAKEPLAPGERTGLRSGNGRASRGENRSCLSTALRPPYEGCADREASRTGRAESRSAATGPATAYVREARSPGERSGSRRDGPRSTTSTSRCGLRVRRSARTCGRGSGEAGRDFGHATSRKRPAAGQHERSTADEKTATKIGSRAALFAWSRVRPRSRSTHLPRDPAG